MLPFMLYVLPFMQSYVTVLATCKVEWQCYVSIPVFFARVDLKIVKSR